LMAGPSVSRSQRSTSASAGKVTPFVSGINLSIGKSCVRRV
jgi:hypothetical protein